MNTTANVKRHPKSGIYRYRRTIPPRLVGLVEPVEGFEFVANRKYFEKSLGVREKAPANRVAGEIDKLVAAALARAEHRLKSSVASAPPASSEGTARPNKVDIRLAFRAIELWQAGRIEELEDRYVNEGHTESGYPDYRDKLALFAGSPLKYPEAWQDVPNFDSALVAALASRDIAAEVGHPALRLLRVDFARAWMEVLKAAEKMRWGQWSFEYESDDADKAGGSPSISNSAAPPASRAPVSAKTPFLKFRDAWKASLDHKSRQISTYVSDLTAFATHVADHSVESLTHEHAQGWVDQLANDSIEGKTIQRKLSAIRSYWQFLKKSKIVGLDSRPFDRLDLPKASKDKIKRKAFSRKQIVDIWKAARARDDKPLADLIRLAAYTGARIESLCTMTAENIKTDDDTGIRTLSFYDKTDAGIRAVPVHTAISGLIDRLVKNTTDGYLIKSTTVNRHGERSPPLSKRFKALTVASSIEPGLVFHSIRKTVCTMFRDAECPEGVAADIVGHEIGTMTYGVYAAGSSMSLRRKWIEQALVYPDEAFSKG
jgi:integrase